MGGEGTTAGVRAVYIWAMVPQIWGLLMWLPAIVIFRAELFTTARPTITNDFLLLIGYMGFLLLQITLQLWSAVLLVAALSEIEEFSIWRAIAALLIFGLILFVFICAILYITLPTLP